MFAWEGQVVVWMPVWGAMRVTCLCREWVFLREVVFLEKNQVTSEAEKCWKCFIKALKGVGNVLERRRVVVDRRNPHISSMSKY